MNETITPFQMIAPSLSAKPMEEKISRHHSTRSHILQEQIVHGSYQVPCGRELHYSSSTLMSAAKQGNHRAAAGIS